MSATAPEMYVTAGDAAQRLRRAFQIERGLVRALGGWLAGVPYWDAKLALGDHLGDHARCASALLARLHELKETSAERQEEPGLTRLLGQLVGAPEGDSFLAGLYEHLCPRLARVYRDWAASIDPVMDPRSGRCLLEAAEVMEAHHRWRQEWKPKFTARPGRPDTRWLESLAPGLAEVERVRTDAVDEGVGPMIAFEGFALPQRDACFRTAYFNEVARIGGESLAERRRVIFYNHTQEMQFAESLGAILHDTPEMPWAFHHDLARHCVDEIKHTRMGCTRLEQLGEDLRDFPMLLQNYALRARLDPIERFCMMTLVIEASSFEKKRANVKFFADHGDTVSERYETYDIRDEMMHVNFGHTWVPIMLRVRQDQRSVTDLIQHCRDILDDALKDERRAP